MVTESPDSEGTEDLEVTDVFVVSRQHVVSASNVAGLIFRLCLIVCHLLYKMLMIL